LTEEKSKLAKVEEERRVEAKELEAKKERMDELLEEDRQVHATELEAKKNRIEELVEEKAKLERLLEEERQVQALSWRPWRPRRKSWQERS